jgi:hypothetical protein
MTENELTDLGFSRVEVNNLESQNGYDYFYYTFDVFENLTLISVDNDRVENEDWYVYNLDWPDQFKLQTKDQVLQFLQSVGHLSEAV